MYRLIVMHWGLKTAPNRLDYHTHKNGAHAQKSPVPAPWKLRGEEVVEGEKKKGKLVLRG